MCGDDAALTTGGSASLSNGRQARRRGGSAQRARSLPGRSDGVTPLGDGRLRCGGQ